LVEERSPLSGMQKRIEDEGNTKWDRLERMYDTHHPQVPTRFEEEVKKFWGKEWKSNTEIGRLRLVMMHRPSSEINIIKPPYEDWRWLGKPDLDRMVQEHERLVKAYRDEGVEVIIRKPEPRENARLVKSMYTEDPSFPAVRGMIIGRMYDDLRRGEELYTYQTLAEIGCPVVGIVHGTGMVEGGGLNWLDEKHLSIVVHHDRLNTCEPNVVVANEEGARQVERILKEQDPEVDVRIGPGYGGWGSLWLWPIDKHTSISDPKLLDQTFVKWLKAEMKWTFLIPPRELSFMSVSGIALRPGKIIKPTGTPKGTKWLESQGIEVVEVDVTSLVAPENTGTIQCLTRELIRDPEPKD
jgi:N-dimethylarginine dimethylaminohydrolase